MVPYDIPSNRRTQLIGRSLLAVLISLALHGLPAATGLLAHLALRALPKSPIEFDLLPPKPKPKATPPSLPIAQPDLTKPPPNAAQRDADAGKPRPPTSTPKPGDKKADKRLDLPRQRMTGLGPSAIDQDLGLRVLLRLPALRASPHRPVVEALLAAFPDTHILAKGAPFAPPPALTLARAFIDDVDTLLIATADPRDITATTFYAQLRPGTDLLSKLGKRHPLRWDSRRISELRPDLFAFARPDLLGPATAPLPPHSPFAPPGDAPAPPPPPPPPGPDLDPAWIDKLALALRQPGPAVYAEITNVHQRIRLRSELPTPTGLRLALTADADPQLIAQIEFATSAEAARFLAALPQLKSELSGRLFWLGLGSLLADLRFSSGPSKAIPLVEIKGRLPRGDTAVLLLWVKGFLPPPDRFPDLVEPPPPPDIADGGTSASDAH